MRKSTLPVKGIRTPQFLVWFRGFWHGKILHTGGLDPETNTITSGYVTGQTKRFYNACVARREKAEEKLIKAWCKADELLVDYAAVNSALSGTDKSENSNVAGNAKIRSAERDAKKRAAYADERQSILKNLVKIANEIRSEYDSAYNQMEATSELLASLFSCYAHGVLMKPVSAYNLPIVNYEDCAKQILTSHEDTWNMVGSILKEVKE